MDGGVLLNLDILSPIKRCLDMGYSEANIVVDVIMPTGANISTFPAQDSYTGWDIFWRYEAMAKYEKTIKDLL